MNAFTAGALLSGIILAPLLGGIIHRTKALFAGRRGAPFLQPYHDLARLLRNKHGVFSGTTTWIFRMAPVSVLVCILAAMVLAAPAGTGGSWGFDGDLILFAYLLGLARFLTVSAALDTGSSFEGMGASREVLYSALAEPALLMGLAVLARISGSLSLSGIYDGLGSAEWASAGTAIPLVLVSFLIVLLAENSRIPFDDPNTHLELTMVHEVMVLDVSGPDFAAVGYAASLKLWLFGSLAVRLALTPFGLTGWPVLPAFIGGMMVLAVLTGVIESVTARLSLLRAPLLLAGAGALSVLAFVLVSRFLG
jgi:formate hydrogenlyase subunit 4